MSVLDRYSDRFYYETKFLDEDLPLWIWDTESTGLSREYMYKEIFYHWKIVEVFNISTRDYSNTLFKPADWFTNISTPNYFVVDLYGISAGGYGSHHDHTHSSGWFGHKTHHWYAAGGSGAVLYMVNAKIRIKDENLEGIVYTMSGTRQPGDGIGGSYDWSVSPRNVYTNTDDWCLKLAQPAMTPNGLAPAGLKILGMAAGGNAWEADHRSYAGNGAARFYIPEQCAFEISITDLSEYTPEVHYNVNQWFSREGVVYKVITEFTASNWATDERFVRPADNYSDSITFMAGDLFWFENKLYRTRKQFQGDYQNTILGFADYFLDKSIVSTLITNNGSNGVARKDAAPAAPATPTRIFTKDDVTDLNELWVEKTLNWGNSQGVNGSRKGYGGQGGGLVMIYKGESS